MRKKSGFTIVEQAIMLVHEFERVVRKLEQQKTPETTIERFQRITGMNPCLCPVCKEGRMVSFGQLPRIRSPAWLSFDIMQSYS